MSKKSPKRQHEGKKSKKIMANFLLKKIAKNYPLMRGGKRGIVIDLSSDY
jgi:hypothetical protein